MLSHMGDFLLLLLLRPILKSQSRGPNSSLEAQIPVLRPKFQSQGPNPSQKVGSQEEEEEEKEKIPICVKALVIDSFRAAALLPPPLTSSTIYSGRARVLLTI